MRFSIISSLLVAASLVFSPVLAANNALGLGFSDAAEDAIHKECESSCLLRAVCVPLPLKHLPHRSVLQSETRRTTH